jgi:hypothetical protein
VQSPKTKKFLVGWIVGFTLVGFITTLLFLERNKVEEVKIRVPPTLPHQTAELTSFRGVPAVVWELYAWHMALTSASLAEIQRQVDVGAAFVAATAAEEARIAEIQRVEAEMAAAEAARRAQEARDQASRVITPSQASPSSSGGGSLSYQQLQALSNCESGGQNGWRTGYFGIEAGYPIGHMSWDEQAAWANRIYADHGASAWGCPIPGG